MTNPFASRSDCLLSFDATDGMPVMRSGQAMTFARASSGTFIDSAGRVALAASHQPRISYGGTAFDTPGYLAEPSSSQLLLRSADPSHAYYTRSNIGSVVQSTVVAAPDGTFSYKVFEDTTSGTHLLTATAITVASGSYGTFSVFIKAGERSRLYFGFEDGANACYATARLDLGTISSAVAGTATTQDSGLQSLGGGWYRAWVTGRCGAAITSLTCRMFMLDNTGASSYVGATTNGIYLWGMDYQAGTTDGAVLRSHIPTVAATVTRNADSLTLTPGCQLPDSFTIYVKIEKPLWWLHTGVVPASACASGGSSSPRWECSLSTSSRIFSGSWYDGTTTVEATGTPTLAASLDMITQFDSIRTLGGRVRVDTGAGLSAYSARVVPVADIGATRSTAIGDWAYSAGNGGSCPIQALRLVSGLRTLDEMRGRR